MPSKIIEIAGIGPVRFIKTAKNRSIRLTVGAGGVRVSLPTWTPYLIARQFVEQHNQYILTEISKHQRTLMQEGDKIGKLHTLHFEQVSPSEPPNTRVTSTKLVIKHHASEPVSSPEVQLRAEKAALRALKKEAEVVLSPRVQKLSLIHGYTYRSLAIKNLKRRWGSCDSGQNLTFSLFLMQLSWQQIDYVICHELAHTEHMHHGQTFWRAVEAMLPDARMIAKVVRYTQPSLKPHQTATAFENDMPY